MTTTSIRPTAQAVACLRKAGNLLEAHSLAEELLSESPDNIWNRRALGWVLVDLLKAGSFAALSLRDILRRLVLLELPLDEELFYTQIRWRIGKIVYHLSGEDVACIEQELALLLKKMPSGKGEAHSFLLKSILKQQEFWQNVPTLINAWGYENFAPGDWQPELLPGGKKCSALVERTYTAAAKWFLKKDDNQEQEFVEKLAELVNGQYDWKFLGYYLALLLKKQKQDDEARTAILCYARKNRNSFWVWELLAELTHGELSKACLVRAVSCKVPDEYLVKTRQKLAATWIASGEWNEAVYEINALLKARQSKGWPVPGQIKRWLKHPAFSSASDSDPVKYTFFLGLADACLLEESEGVEGIIVGVNRDRGTAQFYVSEEINGGFKTKEFREDFEVGQSVKLWLEQRSGSSGSYWQVQYMRLSAHHPHESQKRSFSGMIRRVGTIGFVGEVMISAQLLEQASPDRPVEGISLRAYDARKQKWGWKAISLSDVGKKLG